MDDFIVLFPLLIKYYHLLFIIIVFWLGCDRLRDFIFRASFASFHTHASLHYCCSHAQCLGKHSCMSSPFPKAILNGTFFFRSVKAMNNWKRSAIKQSLLLLLLPILPGLTFLLTFFLTRG